jgi:phage baseplate assembly protein W
MADISHVVGSDLALGPTGDLAAVSDPSLGQQRVLRRLLTNPGEYIWNLTYGAGLPGMVGRPVNPTSIQGLITSQMLRESAVAQSPLPQVTVSSDNGVIVYAYVQYVDAATGQTQVLTVPLY